MNFIHARKYFVMFVRVFLIGLDQFRISFDFLKSTSMTACVISSNSDVSTAQKEKNNNNITTSALPKIK